jgi:methylase of polypeptide subunit release factors
VIDLCLLGQAVPLTELPGELQRLAGHWGDCGLGSINRAGELYLGGRVLLPLMGLWVACDPPQADPRMYLGEDSLALLVRLMPPQNAGRCLDLCAGSGLLGLQAARLRYQVIAVESNDDACRLARLNGVLNGLSDHFEVRAGDLYGPVESERFDWIVANPPCLPYPESLRCPAIGSGGSDGLAFTRRIVSSLGKRLTEQGEAQLIGMTLDKERTPNKLPEVAELLARQQLDGTVTIISRTCLEPGTRFHALLTQAISCASGASVHQVAAAYAELLSRQAATHLCRYSLRVRRGAGRLYLIDMTRGDKSLSWFV